MLDLNSKNTCTHKALAISNKFFREVNSIEDSNVFNDFFNTSLNQTLVDNNIDNTNIFSNQKTNYIISKLSMVSRTTKGGRRRKYSVLGTKVSTNRWLSYILPVKSKDVQKTSAIQKLQSFEDFDKSSLGENSTDDLLFTRLGFVQGSLAKAVFLPSSVNFPISKNIKVFRRSSTITRFGKSNADLGVVADPIQYSLIRSLGISGVFVKNHGSKNKLLRVHHLASILSNLHSSMLLMNRRLGRKSKV